MIGDSDRLRMDAAVHIEALGELFNRLADRGDTEETSQKVCLMNALLKVEHALNGVTEEDFEGDSDEIEDDEDLDDEDDDSEDDDFGGANFSTLYCPYG